jgi:class 3 adenylate cyclase/tetratricopeptide (TPR) repeat protein
VTSGTLTVLFTDLVGSTELMTRLGDSSFDELRGEHFARLREALAAHGGIEVKNTGDGVMATFASTVEAVSCAVAMQQAAARQEVSIRVGLSVGEVSLEDGDAFGTPVVEAARLVAAARPGQILATSVLRLLAGSRVGASFTDLESIDLKGLPAPVPVCEVHWEPLPRSSVPLPAFLTDIGRVFVGRDADLERLQQLWKEATAGEQRVAFLTGEPGVGKTRLAAEVASRLHEEGATVVAGRCDEDLGVPYQPFVEALRHFVDHIPPDEVGGRLGRFGGELTRLVPELAHLDLPSPLESDPETERYRLFDAVAGWLASVEEPLLLVLDDLQWAAKPTLLLLRHVVRSPMKRVFIVGTYRDTELTHDHPLVEVVADLRREGGVERISLSGLDDVGVAAFIEQAGGRTLDEDGIALARAIYRETEGNPFFVREVLRHLAETGVVERQEEGWSTRRPVEQLGIPEGVRDVVGRRLSRLSAGANQALRVAAVVGPEFDMRVVRDAGGIPEEALLTALEEAVGARLLSEVSAIRYRFTHALIRATLYDSLTAARKVTLHRKVAEAIETVQHGALDDHLPALAHHWARASAPAADTARAVEYTRRAGDRALAQLAHDEAVAYYRQALELLDVGGGHSDPTQRLQLLLALGEAQRRAGDPAYRETLLAGARLAQDRGDASALARAALANTRGMLQSSVVQVDAERVAALEAALSAGIVADSPERARLLATLGLELTASGERDRRLALSDEALSMARRLGDDATLTHVLTARFYTFISPDTLVTRLADTAELTAVAERLGDPLAVAQAYLVRARANTEHGDITEARFHLEAAEAIAAELGQPTLRWYTTWARAAHLILSGRLAEAETAAMDAGRLADATSQPDGPLYLASQLLAIRLEQDRLEEVESAWLDAAKRFPEAPLLRTMLAVLHIELDRTAEAHRLLQGLGARDFADIPVNNLWLWIMTSLSVVASRTSDEDKSATLLEYLTPYADQIAGVAALWTGSVFHYLGLLNTTLRRFEQAETNFTAAEATHQRIGAPIWLAHTRLERARMLLTRRQPGDTERARELVGQAQASAKELGVANVERRAVELLA